MWKRESDSPAGWSFCFKRASPRLAVIILRAVNCSKGGAGIFRQGRGEKSSGPPLRGLLTNPHHYVILPCRDGTRNGLFRSELGTGRVKEGRKRLGEGVQRAAAQPAGNNTSRCRNSFYRLRRGALATGWTSAPCGGVRRTRGFFYRLRV